MITSPIPAVPIRPDALKPGDRVALISPSYVLHNHAVEKAAGVLRSWGLEPVIGPHVGRMVDGQYAGTVEERLEDLLWAFRDPSIQAIFCNRGGYGTIQFIGRLDPAELQASPKWLIGYSDISTLHGLLTRAGVMSIHGPMGSFLCKHGTDQSSLLLRDLLFGTVPSYRLPAHPQSIGGSATGTLVGGNLCTFVPNLGTEADATMGKDLILLVEEVEESLHNIDRQMRILQLNGVLDRCKGVILGEFTNCGTEFTADDGQPMSAEALLHRLLAPYGIPVLCGFPAGHGDVNFPLVMGASVTLEVGPDGGSIRFNL